MLSVVSVYYLFTYNMAKANIQYTPMSLTIRR